MLIIVFLAGSLQFIPFDILIPVAVGSLQFSTPFVRTQLFEVLRFQILWTVVLTVLRMFPSFLDHDTTAVAISDIASLMVSIGGVVLVLMVGRDATSTGHGSYPIRLPWPGRSS